MTTELSLAVFQDCDRCDGTGASDLFDDRGIQKPCSYCNGYGKRPTFIPIDELTVPGRSEPIYFGSVVDLRESIRGWLERQKDARAATSPETGS